MKSIAVALLLGVASAKKLHKKDAPAYFNQPTWNEKFPSATGFAQEKSADAPPYFNQPTWNEKFPSATGFAEQKDAPPYFNEPTWNEKFPSATGFSSIEGPPFFNEPAFNDRMPAGAGFIQTQGPEGFGEPAFNERMPSASGFIQLSICEQAGVEGVTCAPPNQQLFAVGMNGDEDLGQDITMKGEKYHYSQSLQQWVPVVVHTPHNKLPACSGVNGPVDVNCKRVTCTGTNGPMDGPASSGCLQPEPASIPKYHDDPHAGRPYQTTGDLTHTDQVPMPAPYPGQNSHNFAQTEGAPIKGEPEKVSILDTPIAKTHTTFYGQNDEQSLAEGAPIKGEPEKVSVLDTPICKTHTTFYGQSEEQNLAEGAPITGEPEKVSILDTPICKTHTTFYGQGKEQQ